MPPNEPGLAPVIQLPLKRRPSPEQEEHRQRLLHARQQARRLRRMKLKLALVGAVLVGFLGAGLSMALDSTDPDGGPLAEKDTSSEDSPFESSSEESEDLSGPAWFSTTGGGRRGR